MLSVFSSFSHEASEWILHCSLLHYSLFLLILCKIVHTDVCKCFAIVATLTILSEYVCAVIKLSFTLHNIIYLFLYLLLIRIRNYSSNWARWWIRQHTQSFRLIVGRKQKQFTFELRSLNMNRKGQILNLILWWFCLGRTIGRDYFEIFCCSF